MGSNHMISPVEKPIIRSMWFITFVTWLISWHRQCPLVKRILVRWSDCSCSASARVTSAGTVPFEGMISQATGKLG